MLIKINKSRDNQGTAALRALDSRVRGSDGGFFLRHRPAVLDSRLRGGSSYSAQAEYPVRECAYADNQQLPIALQTTALHIKCPLTTHQLPDISHPHRAKQVYHQADPPYRQLQAKRHPSWAFSILQSNLSLTC